MSKGRTNTEAKDGIFKKIYSLWYASNTVLWILFVLSVQAKHIVSI